MQNTIIVPTGFRTDFASTPRLPVVYLVAGNVATKAAVIHNYLYSGKSRPRVSRELADCIFREASEVIGVSRFRRWMMWAGVRMGGISHHAASS